MAEEKNPHDLPRWVFPVALFGMLLIVTFGTFFWMWRDARPRRRAALLGASDPMARNNSSESLSMSLPADMSWTNGMVRIPSGKFMMGSVDGAPDEQPVASTSASRAARRFTRRLSRRSPRGAQGVPRSDFCA